MAITIVDDIAAGLAIAQSLPFDKNITAAKSAGAFQSTWLATGRPGAGAAPPAYTAGSGYTCDDATAGAFGYVNAAVQNWVARWRANGGQRGTLYLSDRLWACSGMGFANATYTVTTPGTLPARITDNGVGTEIWVEQYVAAGAASGTLTVNVTDVAGGARACVIPAVVSAPVIGQMQPVPFLTGMTGVRSLVSVVNSATWTSGSWGMVILKPITSIPINDIGVESCFDWSKALKQVPADACLMLHWMANVTTALRVNGEISIIDK